MKLTTKGRYAVTAMLDLALHAGNGPISLAEISTRQEISLSYLEQLFSKLRKRDLVSSTRGPGGGYRVSRGLENVFVSEIINAVNESVDATQCGGKENCLSTGRCLTHDLWDGLSVQIEEFLSGVSLQNLIDNHNVKAVAIRQQAHVDGKPLVNGVPDQMSDQLVVQRDRNEFAGISIVQTGR